MTDGFAYPTPKIGGVLPHNLSRVTIRRRILNTDEGSDRVCHRGSEQVERGGHSPACEQARLLSLYRDGGDQKLTPRTRPIAQVASDAVVNESFNP
jgi:hypothetical protein